MSALRFILGCALWLSITVLCLPPAFASDWGFVPLQVFPPRTFNANPQVWAAAQDTRGLMYFANPDGVLEFDGDNWRRIPLPGNIPVRAVASAPEGRIAVGGQREFGYLEPDSSGSLHYRSLVPSLPPEDRSFGDIWSVFTVGDSVYFSSSTRLFRARIGGAIHTWRPAGTDKSFGRAFPDEGRILIPAPGTGIYSLTGNKMDLLPGGERFIQTGLRALFRWDGRLTALTRDGIFRWNNGKFDPFPTEADKLFREQKIYTAQPLPNGDLAVGTIRSGLVLLDKKGQLLQRVGKLEGLPADYVLSLALDQQGGLWITTVSGIARFQPGSTIFDERLGLQGGALAITRYEGTIYAGTQTGLYALRRTSGRQARFEPVPGIAETIVVLMPSPSGLLAGGQRGLYLLDKSGARLVFQTDVIYDLQRCLRDPSLLFAVGRAGLTVLRETESEWQREHELPSGGREFRSVVEGQDGKLWIASRASVFRVDFSKQPAEIEQFGAQEGVPPGWNNWYRIGGIPVLGTDKGVLRFDESRRSFLPDTRFTPLLTDGSRPATLLKEDRFGGVWASGKGYHGRQNGIVPVDTEWLGMPLLQSGLTELWTMHFDSDGVLWTAGPDGWIARCEPPAQRENLLPSLQVLLREVEIRESHKEIFGGSGGLGRAPQIRYKDNTLRFAFSLPVYEPERHAEYQVRLAGSDRTWSEWTRESMRDYTHLPEGRYVFHVRARHPLVKGSEVTSFAFTVLPPWYRTLWAYILYALATAAAIWLVAQWRLQQLRASNIRLEAIVEERTQEIRNQHKQLIEQERKTEALLLNILPAPVADELRSTGMVKPQKFDNVTVCFTDFVGFTLSGRGRDARVVVEALHEYFTAFDRVMVRYGLEKLKTIGDAYMFVGGLPNRKPSHAVDTILAALEMNSIVSDLRGSRLDLSWNVRVGAHAGPVVAGVVGTRKFTFDIWGDTVNLASRFETCSEPSRVNISRAVYDEVKDFIRCEPRGQVRTKEGLLYEMFFACEVHQELLQEGPDGKTTLFEELYRSRFGTPAPVVPAAVAQTSKSSV